MPIEVDTLCHLAARDREEDRAPAAVTRALEVLERHRRLQNVCRLDEDQLVLQHLRREELITLRRKEMGKLALESAVVAAVGKCWAERWWWRRWESAGPSGGGGG
eukprot:2438927-Pleurochrysis_carterae.AAC.1